MAAEGSPATVASHFADAERQETAANLGMWIFLTTEVLFFGVLFAGYTVTRVLHADAFALAGRHTDVLLGSINTAVLLTSSLTMALAVRAGSIGWRRRCVAWLAVTLVLGTVFLGIKGYASGTSNGWKGWCLVCTSTMPVRTSPASSCSSSCTSS